MKMAGWILTALGAIIAAGIIAHLWPTESAAMAGPATVVLGVLTGVLAWSTREMTLVTKATLAIEERRSYAQPHVTTAFGWIDSRGASEDGATLEVENLGTISCVLAEVYVACVEWDYHYDEDGIPHVIGVREDPYRDPLPQSAFRSAPPGRKWARGAVHSITIDTTGLTGPRDAGYKVKLRFEGGEECERSIQPFEVPNEGE